MNKILENPSKHFSAGCFVVIFIDLDLFKLINDTYGHLSGDNLLKDFANRLKSIFRSSDYVIRHGGDEFIVLLEGEYPEKTISLFVQNIHDVLRHPFNVGSDLVNITCSIGIAVNNPESGADELLRQADIAMYEAKNSGRNSHRIYSAQYGEQVKYQLFLEQGLRRAVEQEKLQVWFQPVVDANANLISFEALCRWQDEHAGFISPEQFIPVAERSWLIIPLGFLVFKKACQCARRMQEGDRDSIKINVNVSPKQLAAASLPVMLKNIMDEFGVTGQQFTLEITENVLQSAELLETLEELRKMGFTIALDDFGTGYSNLARLKAFPIDVIKIDKSLVQGRFVNGDQKIVCDAVMDMCRKLGFCIVVEGVEGVEGVETASQAEYFGNFPDVLQQGFYHGRPTARIEDIFDLSPVVKPIN